MGLVIRPRQVDEIMQLLEDGGDLEPLRTRPVDGVSLDAATELACRRWTWEKEQQDRAVGLFDAWSSAHPVLSRAWRALSQRQGDDVSSSAAPRVELRPAPLRVEIGDLTWEQCLERFRRSLRDNGKFPAKLAAGLAGTFEEMVSNLLEHSGADEQHPAPGVVGYKVGLRRMTFAVADVGRGVLASLRTNPRWTALTNSLDALIAAICEQATSKHWLSHGDGFRQVHKTLADLSGTLRFRSGDGVLTLDGRGTARQRVKSRAAAAEGFQLAVSCALDPPK